MKYVRVPRELRINEIRSDEISFSPSRYSRFIPPELKNSSHYVPLDKLVSVRDQKVNVRKGEIYRYAEIGDINVATGAIYFRSLKGYQLPTVRPACAARGDILISTVRTYRKGIGLVMDNSENLVTTTAVLNFCGTTEYVPGITLPYLYSFLRTDFFVEQVWSLLHRGVYPRMDTGALGRISIPISTNPELCAYVSAITLAIADKVQAIRERDAGIYAAIQAELDSNQKRQSNYEYPSLSEIAARGRFDAAIYSREYKSKISLIQNYSRGYVTPGSAGFTVIPGPSLEIKLLQTRLDSSVSKPGFYQLLIPTNISEHGTMNKVSWLGTARKLPLLRMGDILFGEAGFQKGRSIVLIDEPERATTNAHGLYARRSDGDLKESIFFRCIFNWYRKQRLIDLMAVGGSGGHFSPEYFESLLIPNFPDDVKQRIVDCYHKSPVPPSTNPTLASFVDWHRERNRSAGIWELDREMKSMQETLDLLHGQIIEGREIKMSADVSIGTYTGKPSNTMDQSSSSSAGPSMLERA